MGAHSEICICGHPTNRHADTDLWYGWGMGKCELCKCHKFECQQCIDDKYNLNINGTPNVLNERVC